MPRGFQRLCGDIICHTDGAFPCNPQAQREERAFLYEREKEIEVKDKDKETERELYRQRVSDFVLGLALYYSSTCQAAIFIGLTAIQRDETYSTDSPAICYRYDNDLVKNKPHAFSLGSF